MNAAFLGALISLLLVMFELLFYYVLEDAVYVERDAKERFGLPVYGLLTRGNDELQKQMFEDNLEFIFGKEPKDNLKDKTGTMRNYSSLYGVLKTRKENDVIFSIVVQDSDKRKSLLKNFENTVVGIIYKNY